MLEDTTAKPRTSAATTLAPPQPFTRRWLSQREAAEYLGVSDRTIRVYLTNGALKSRRLKGSRRTWIDRLAIDAALSGKGRGAA